MATAIYRVPNTTNLRLRTATLNERWRAGECFAIDDADSAQVAAVLAAGYNISLFLTDPDIVDLGTPNTYKPHNPYNLS